MAFTKQNYRMEDRKMLQSNEADKMNWNPPEK